MASLVLGPKEVYLRCSEETFRGSISDPENSTQGRNWLIAGRQSVYVLTRGTS